ncbi:MAG: type II CAAX endopeptidase family protein [Chloroflexota bacterium]
MKTLPYAENQASFFVRNQVSLFVLLTFVASSFWIVLAWLASDENFSILAVFMPSLVAIGMVWIINGRSALRPFLKLNRQRLKSPWLLISLFLIPAIAFVATTLHSLAGGVPFGLRTTELLPALIVILLISFGEEYGWRGFLLPRLQERYSALVASLILGAVWGLWHFPAYLIGTGVPLGMPFWVFLLWVLLATIILTWVYNQTNSMLAPILLHSSANAAFNFFWLLPEFTGQMQTFWIFLLLLGGITAVVAPRLARN